MPPAERVAIVGMAGRFPGAGADLDLFWENVAGGIDCAREVPPGRWPLPPSACTDPRVPHPDAVYCTRGYYLDPFTADLAGLPVPTELVAALDPLFHLVLDVGHRAWKAAKTRGIDRRKVGVVLGNICLPTDKASDLAREYLGGRVARVVGGTPEPRRTHPLNRYPAGLPAGLLAKALGLGGGTFTLDAACASSLYAVKLACDELLSGRADVMLAGGSSRPDSQYTQMGFAQLRALSASGRCSPFDAAADGLMVGEGAGVFALKRLSDALRAGDTIHAVVCGAGLSNDTHGNLLAPAKEGQLRAMRAAYEKAGWKPQFADLVECHATGTPVGDAVEFESLRELWGTDGWKPGQCAIGSVKSTVGHLLTGAGAAALTKVLLGFAHKTRPPQANFARPGLTLSYDGGPFRVLTEAEPWEPRRPTLPRRAAVSGFGFGGVNAHLLVEEYVGQTYVEPGPAAAPRAGSAVLRTAASRTAGTQTALEVLRSGPVAAGATLRKSETDAATQSGVRSAAEPVAVVGLAAHFGPWETLRAFQEYVLGGTQSPAAVAARPGWAAADAAPPPGFFLDSLTARLDRFRIPPKELEEMLPQQLAMLTAAAAALDDCRGTAPDPDAAGGDPRTGVFIGLNLDLNTTNFHLRWAAKKQAFAACDGRNPDPTGLARATLTDSELPAFTDPPADWPAKPADPALAAWAEGVADAVSPPLTADRVMGALGSIAASRVARAFHFGGPSFTVCSEETSSGRAVELAVRALRARELDRAVAGGVDLAGDPRALLAMDAQRPLSTLGAADPLGRSGAGSVAGEGAAALVLKRLADAERDGDRVYAIIAGVGCASGGLPEGLSPDPAAYATSLMRACADAVADPATVEYLEAAASGCPADDKPEAEAVGALLRAQQNRTAPLAIGAVRGQVGQVGAAGSAAGLVKACLALFHQVLPPTTAAAGPRAELAAVGAACHWAAQPRFWLHDRATGPRRALAAATGVDGTAVHVLLEEYAGPAAGTDADRAQPLGARPEAVFAVEEDTVPDLLAGLDLLDGWAKPLADRPVEYLAREWLKLAPPAAGKKRAAAFVARSGAELLEQVAVAREALRDRPEAPLPDPAQPEARPALRDRVFYSPAPLGPKGKVAVVFPGSGNQFPGMARDLSAQWPEVLRRQQGENAHLRGQYAPDKFWGETIPADTTAKHFLFGQVAVGTLTADLLANLGLRADALIGQSLGESAGLFGLRVWRDRDEMFRRIHAGSLFGPDLGPPYEAAKTFWGMRPTEVIDWVSGVLAVPADDVRAAMRPGLRAYLLISTTPTECVIGGLREDVDKVVAQFQAPFFPLPGVTLAHCELGQPVEQPYRALHTLPTTPPPGLTVFSGAWGRSYKPTPENCADSITAGLVGPIDFPAVVNAAYKDGVRAFVEAGPGNSAARMVAAILADRPHLARAVTAPRQDGTSLVLRTVANLIAERLPVDLRRLYATDTRAAGHAEPAAAPKRAVQLPVGLPAKPVPPRPGTQPPPVEEPTVDLGPVPLPPEAPPAIPARIYATDESTVDLGPVHLPPAPPVFARDHESTDELQAIAALKAPPFSAGPGAEVEDVVWHGLVPVDPVPPAAAPPLPPPPAEAPPPRPPRKRSTVVSAMSGNWAEGVAPFVAACAETQAAAAAAHAAYLRVQAGLNKTSAAALQTHAAVVSRLLGNWDDEDEAPGTAAVPAAETGTRPAPPPFPPAVSPPRPAEAAGPAAVPGTVPRALTREQCVEFAAGKVGTVLGSLFSEADGFPTRVRLPDGPLMLVDRITLIEGEPRSMTRGRVLTDHDVTADRWYLDAGRIPTCVAVEAGQADLFLSGFLGIDFETRGLAVYRLLDAVVTFHRGLPVVGDTIKYDIHVDGFFRQGDTWLFRFRFESTVDGQPLLSMTNGVAGFFSEAELASGKGIVHTKFDTQPMAGKLPADWRAFVPVAAGGLGADAVAALRRGDLVAAFGPAFAAANLQSPMKLPGGMLRLLDRVTHLDPVGGRFGTGFVRAEYDIHPDDWFLTCHFVDDMVMPGTLMYECCLHTLRVLLMRLGWVGEDGAVACEPVPEMSSRLKCRGQVVASTKTVAYEVTVKELGYGPEPFCVADALMYADGKPIVEIGNMTLRMTGLTREKLEAIWSRVNDAPSPPAAAGGLAPEPKPALYDRDRILAYSNGNPSEAFGEPYRVFDKQRVLARLPGPPFQFLDRVVAVTGEPFVMKDGAACTAEYDVPSDAWYFAGNRAPKMPFSVLLEVALQPCGWLAAYCGSALHGGDTDLSFRNLGGGATQFRAVGPDAGALTVSVTMTRVSKSAGMIIQHYDLQVADRVGVVYEGTTYFGFFSKPALRNQVGMTTAKVPYLTAEQKATAETGDLPHDPPFPAPMLRMVDRIEGYLPAGGRAGLGLVQGKIAVDPGFWFFKAHFYQDPVWPGSLGLESFLQLLKYAAWKRWGDPPPGGWQTVALDRHHEWVYRGQVVPADKTVTVVLEITAADDAGRRLTADGFLTVDGRVIYQMTGFTLEC